jgi:hypothetical protein
MQMQVGPDVHYRSKRHGPFIECLEEVGEHHDGKDSLVNQSLESLVLFGSNLDACAISILGELLVYPTVIHVIFGDLLCRHDSLDPNHIMVCFCLAVVRRMTDCVVGDMIGHDVSGQ